MNNRNTPPTWAEAPALAAALYAHHAYTTRHHGQPWMLVGTDTASGTVWRLAASDTLTDDGIYLGRGGTNAGALAEANRFLASHVPARRLVGDIANRCRWSTDRALLYVRQHASEMRGTTKYRPEVDAFTNATANRLLNNASR